MRKRLYTMRHLLYGMTGLAVAVLVGSCRAKVDLNNVDMTAEAEMGIALPIGSMSATVGDLLTRGQVEQIYVDSLNRNIITFKDTLFFERNFHPVNLAERISETDLTMNVYEQLAAMSLLQNGRITGNDQPFTITFPMSLKLSGINNDESYERLDSALIANADFSSVISRQNLPIEWDWINSVSIELGDAFRRPAGKTLEVYRRGGSPAYSDFGQEMAIGVDNFSLNLMKNTNPNRWEEYWGNVIDSCTFLVHFNVTIPSSAGQIEVPQDAAFRYHLGVRLLEFEALWGMFEPSSQMHDEDLISIADNWEPWKLLKQAVLPFSDPSVDIYVTTQLAGALKIQDAYLFVSAADQSNPVYATFNGSRDYYRTFERGEYLSLNSAIGDSTTMHVRFDKDPDRGAIDKLFAVRPDLIGYRFSIDFDRQSTPQIRLVNNTGIRLNAIATLPFAFNKGMALTYSDTLSNINISSLDLDSLLGSVEVLDTLKSSDVKLYLHIENSIPLRIRVVLHALDENGNVIMDPSDPTMPYHLTTSDTLLLDAGLNINGQSVASETTDIVSINQSDFDTFSQIKEISYDLIVDDDENVTTEIQSHNKLKLRIGLAANVEAVLNLNNVTDNQ